MEKIVEASKGQESFRKILSILKNEYRVRNWQHIGDQHFGEIIAFLNRYYYGIRDNTEKPRQIKNKLKGIIKSQQRELRLSDKQYREFLRNWTGKSSTTQMDMNELEEVKHQLNILLSKE